MIHPKERENFFRESMREPVKAPGTAGNACTRSDGEAGLSLLAIMLFAMKIYLFQCYPLTKNREVYKIMTNSQYLFWNKEELSC